MPILPFPVFSVALKRRCNDRPFEGGGKLNIDIQVHPSNLPRSFSNLASTALANFMQQGEQSTASQAPLIPSSLSVNFVQSCCFLVHGGKKKPLWRPDCYCISATVEGTVACSSNEFIFRRCACDIIHMRNQCKVHRRIPETGA